MSTFLQTMHNASTRLHYQATKLRRLGSAFLATGNSLVAEKLFDAADAIEDVERDMTEGFDKQLREEHQQAKEQMGGILHDLLHIAMPE